MSIRYLKKEGMFKLDTPGTSYVCAVVNAAPGQGDIVEDRFLLHVYYGAKISDDDLRYLTRIYEAPFTPSVNNRDNGSFLDAAYFEYPTEGVGDGRSCWGFMICSRGCLMISPDYCLKTAQAAARGSIRVCFITALRSGAPMTRMPLNG